MPTKGRPRISAEVYAARLAAYCTRYGVSPSAEGLAPFPAGGRETPQHREWVSLYKAHSRLARRGRGQCERCAALVSDGSVFCDAHRSQAAGSQGASLEDRHRCLKAQHGRCPICGRKVALEDDAADHFDTNAQLRAVLHRQCRRLVTLVERAGPGVLERLNAYLSPSAGSTARGRSRPLR
jgi:hypothetical protein